MSNNSMRWPGADGSPGLDFSSGATEPETPVSGSSASGDELPGAEVTSPTSPASMATPPSAPSPARAADRPGAQPERATSGGDGSPWSDRPLNQPEGNPSAEETHVISPVPATQSGSGPESVLSPQEAARANAFSNERTQSWQANNLTEATVGASLSTAAVAGATSESSVAVPPVAAAPAATTSQVPPRKKTPQLRRTRKARLRLARIDPWSVMKTAFLFSIAFGVMIVVITTVLWTVLLGSGALQAVDEFLVPLLSDGENVIFSISDYLNTSRVVGFSALIAAIDVVIVTAVATLIAFLYNMAATLMGGLEVTLAED